MCAAYKPLYDFKVAISVYFLLFVAKCESNLPKSNTNIRYVIKKVAKQPGIWIFDENIGNTTFCPLFGLNCLQKGAAKTELIFAYLDESIN